MVKDKLVTLNIKESTKERFNKRGVKGQTDDKLLNVIIDSFDNYYKKEGDEEEN